MAKQKTENKEYLYGTFSGEKGCLSIDANTPAKEVESFIKANPSAKDLILNADKIKAQRELMKK